MLADQKYDVGLEGQKMGAVHLDVFKKGLWGGLTPEGSDEQSEDMLDKEDLGGGVRGQKKVDYRNI